MKHLSCLKTLLFLLFAVPCLHSCSREEELPARVQGKSVRLTVEEARHYVESQLARFTRNAGEDAPDRLVLGNYSVDWSRAESSVGDILYSVDVPAEGTYSYCSVGFDSLGTPVFTPMYHKLVVVKDGETEAMESYIRFYIPTREHALAHSEPYYDALLNSDVKGDFTGMSVYTTLDGFPVCAGRYAEGMLEASGFLGDTLRTVEENALKIANLLDGMLAVRMSCLTRAKDGGTKPGADADTAIRNLGGIDDVIVIGKPLQKKNENVEFKWEPAGGGGDIPKPDPLDDDKPFTGGSGNKEDDPDKSDDDDGRYEKNKNIATDDPKVRKYLDEFLEDCIGQKLVGSIRSYVHILTNCFGNSVVIPINMEADGHVLSQTFTIYLDSNLTDYKLMEELIHVHQYTGKPLASVNTHKLNNEIEAKLGWVMYLDKYDKLDGVDSNLGGEIGRDVFLNLADCFFNNDFSSSRFAGLYGEAVQTLRGMRAYSNEEAYPFSPDYMSMEALQKLMEDCLKMKN